MSTESRGSSRKIFICPAVSLACMTSIVILNGSPRHNGNTAVLINAVSNALADFADVDVQRLQLNEYHIKPCQSCQWCMKEYPLSCIQQDDMNTLYHYVLDADTIVFASPVYWFHYSAQLKLFIDRLYALHKEDGHALQGKKFAAIFVYGDKDQTHSGVLNAIGSYTDFVQYLHGTNLGIVTGTAMRIGDALRNQALLADIASLSATLAS